MSKQNVSEIKARVFKFSGLAEAIEFTCAISAFDVEFRLLSYWKEKLHCVNVQFLAEKKNRMSPEKEKQLTKKIEEIYYHI